MSNQLTEMAHIKSLFGTWMSTIRLNSYENYTDINRVGEHLSRQLINKIYGFQLEDLNRVKANFPGLDIGDDKTDLIAYQVTSRVDNKKILESLKTVVAQKYNDTFTNGIRFLILNDTEKVSFGPKAKKMPAGVLSTFKLEDDIIYPKDLIKKIEDIYESEADLIKFNQIKLLLEKDLILKPTGKPEANTGSENKKLAELLAAALEKLATNKEDSVNISTEFFHGDLKVPAIKVASPRKELVEEYWKKLSAHDVLWLRGAPSTGKTSIAFLLAEKSPESMLWIECRDVPDSQLMEHIIRSLCSHLNIPIQKYFRETIEKISVALPAQATIVLNDIAETVPNKVLQQQLGEFLSLASSQGVQLLVTSNYAIPSDMASTYDLDVDPVEVPPFEEQDTDVFLESLGADEHTASLFAGIVTQTTQGHPLLVQSAGKYLQEKSWLLDEEVIRTMFSGKFGDAVEHDIYERVLAHTAGAETRELLYRLRHVVGSFDMSTIQEVSAIEPAISHPAEKINQVKGIWLQETATGSFQLSPLIKTLDGNTDQGLKRKIYSQLAIKILSKKNISQIEAFTVIFYFMQAGEYNRAAYTLFNVLTIFSGKPELFFDWGFDLFWWNKPFPEEVSAFLKVQIRVLQITAAMRAKKDATFLINDLKNINEKEDAGVLGKAMVNLLFFQLKYASEPIASFAHLVESKERFKEIKDSPVHIDFFDDEFLNSIWFVFTNIHTKEDYTEWLRLFRLVEAPADVTDPNNNELYAMAGVSIYRNAVLINKESGTDIPALLHYLVKTFNETGLTLLAAYAMSSLAKYLIEQNKDWEAAIELTKTYGDVLNADPLYKFLVYQEITSRFFNNGEPDKARFYFDEIGDFEPSAFYTEYLDHLIAGMQLVHSEDPERSGLMAKKALDFALEGKPILVDDKVKLYGEAAIAATRDKDFNHAMELYESGYLLLLENFNNSEEHQALVIRYGNAIKYVTELIEYGKADSFSKGKFVKPEVGFFFRSNVELLAGGFYFDERKFIVSMGLQASFEALGNLSKAKVWAYKSFELSGELSEVKFLAAAQANLFYLVEDRQFTQAYNIQAYIDSYYHKLKRSYEEGTIADEGLKTFVHDFNPDDLTIYVFILLPITLSFSLDIIFGRVTGTEYQKMIDDAFSMGKYQVQDEDSLSFIKMLFEKILIGKISYTQMQELFENYKGPFKYIFYVIGCILLSSFSNAVDSAHLQLAIINDLDLALEKTGNMHRFCITKYILEFWKQKAITHSGEFSGREHFLGKGFTLVEKAEWKLKIRTLFRVLADHLKLRLSADQEKYLESK